VTDASFDGRPALVLAGPTASGKSAVALALGSALPITIINADAMQIYRGLAALTAQPDAAARAGTPHLLYGMRAPTEPATVVWWRDQALAAIATTPPGHLPVVVGGTGLYLHALARGLHDIPPVPDEFVRALEARRAEIGPRAFHAELAAVDPVTAARLNAADRQRVTRALAVARATGRPLSDWLAAPPPATVGPRILTVRLDPPRAALYARIDARVPRLVADGALDEVRRLIDLDPRLPAAKALGFADLSAHLAGTCDLATAIARTAQATRHYAKRQTTWFRHRLAPDMILDAQECDNLTAQIFSFVRQRGLTG
jgi:tRNA dimethylallyltransferase